MRNSIETQRVSRESSAVWHGYGWLAKLFIAYCRRIPNFPGKRRLYEWFSCEIFQNECMICDDGGVRLTIDPSDYIGRMMICEGCYEPKSLALAVAIMLKGGTFVDVGSNFGLYTVVVGSLPRVRSIAIDGSFAALNMLARNLQLNPGVDAEVINCAVGPENTLRCFEVPEDRNLGTTKVAKKVTGIGPSASRFWTAGTTLQEVFGRLGIEEIEMLKIDVEGFESEVFKGLDFDGPYRPRNLIVECDLEFEGTLKSFEFLVSKGYKASSVDGNAIGNCEGVPEHNVWFHST